MSKRGREKKALSISIKSKFMWNRSIKRTDGNKVLSIKLFLLSHAGVLQDAKQDKK